MKSYPGELSQLTRAPEVLLMRGAFAVALSQRHGALAPELSQVTRSPEQSQRHKMLLEDLGRTVYSYIRKQYPASTFTVNPCAKTKIITPRIRYDLTFAEKPCTKTPIVTFCSFLLKTEISIHSFKKKEQNVTICVLVQGFSAKVRS